MSPKTRLALLTLLCALVVPAVAAPPAFADSCTATLEDSAGNDWDLTNDGAVDDGETDAYDNMGEMWLTADGDDSSGVEYTNPDSATCTYDDDGREIVYPTDDDAASLGVNAHRKIYVPDEGMDFARWLDVIENPTDSAITLAYEWYGDYGAVTQIAAEEDGDGHVALGERWAAVADDSDDTDVTSLWDGPVADGWDRPYENDQSNVPNPGNSTVDYIYDDVTIPAGGRAIFMHIEHQADSAESAAEWGEANNLGDEEFFAGMTAEEIADLRNWDPDGDADGVRSWTDNCPAAANANQSDIDADGLGDACDDDIDGDGLTNAQEEAIGMDPRSADSDRDGVVDGLDQCPTRAGAERGCPPVAVAATSTPPPATVPVRLRPNRLTLTVRKTRPTRRSLRLRGIGRILLPAGVTPADGCRSGVVAVVVRAGGATVSVRLATLRPDCTYRGTVTFRRAGLRRLGNRRLTVGASFTGNDRLRRRSAARVSAGRA